MDSNQIKFKYYFVNHAPVIFSLQDIESGGVLKIIGDDFIKTRKQFTNFYDKNKTELFDGDILKDDENNYYHITWNKNNTSWWMSPVLLDTSNIDFMFVFASQSLGNGYFIRRDLLLVGNSIQNPEYLK